jgi:hypothetical protein
MEPKTIVHCSECRQPTISGEWFVCFKVPGKEYQFFHRRIRVGDCRAGHLKQSKQPSLAVDFLGVLS